MFHNSNNSHRKRQSINRCESQDICSPAWIRDLIASKRDKLVDIVNCANSANSGDESQTNFEIESEKSYVKPELTSSELSKSGWTSIGSTSISPSVSLCKTVTQALNECQSCHSYQSCQHLQRDVPSQCDRQSGFDIKTEAVHLHIAGSRVNVPIARSVSSSVITGRPFSGCGSSCVECCLEHLRSLSVCELASNESTNDINKCLQNSTPVQHKSCTPKVSDSTEEQITPGLVAQRKIEILQRQVSDSSFLAHTCAHTCALLCGKTDALSNENFLNNLVKHKMICEKNRDKSDYNDRTGIENNGHHYEEIMDYKRSPFVNTCHKHSKLTNGVEREDRDDEYDFKYGPGIVDRLKHKFMSISVEKSNYTLKRSSSLENILVDWRQNQSLQSLQTQQSLPSHLSRIRPSSEANDLLPLLGKNSTISVSSITGAGKLSNGSQLSHRIYIQRHNNKNLYNSKSSAIVPLIKRAKSMETLLLQQGNGDPDLSCDTNHDCQQKDRTRQSMSSVSNKLSKRETPLSKQNQLNDSVLIYDTTDSHISANTTMSHKTIKMQNVSQLTNGITDELPKPDTVKTYKRIFEPTGPKTVSDNSIKSVVNNVNNKTKSNNNNYKKSQLNGNASAANVKRKPPVLRATNKSAALKTQTSVNSSPAIKSQSPLPQVIETVPSPSHRTTVTPVVGPNDKNNNSNDINKSAITSNTSNTSNSTAVRKPPIAPKRASLTLKASPLTDNKITEKSMKSKVNDPSLNSKTPLAVNGKKESSDISSNTQMNGKSEPLDSCESLTNISKVVKPIANIKPFTQNNQINGELKSEVMLNNCQLVDNEENVNDLGHNKSYVNSIADESEPQLDQDFDPNNKLMNNINNKTNNKSDNETNGNVLESPLISNLNCNTNANKESNDEKSCVVVVNDENVSPNTCDIAIVKNRANDPLSPPNEHPIQDLSMHSQQTVDVLKPSLLLNSDSNHLSKTVTSSLWSQHNNKSINSSTTTIVFDFRGKDVKSNLAIHPLPFGVSAPKRRNGSSNGKVNDSDDDDNYSGSTETPLPSGIMFFGENVRVGKGSLLLTRNKKLSVQFNDSAVETFEYPSEAFLSNEVKAEAANNSVISDSNSRITGLNGIGASQGLLGSYKPTVIDKTFELGVSRVETKNDAIIKLDIDQDQSDVVKPANAGETSSWSTSSTASDLLF